MKIGMHVAKDGFVNTAKSLLDVGSKAIQVYLSNNRSFDPGVPMTKYEVAEICRLREEKDLYVVVHGKLILNLCQDDMRNIPALTCDIYEASRIGADVVIHQGKNVKKCSKEEALSRYVMNVIEALDQTAGLKNKILLENSCQQGTELGYNLDDLVSIWKLLFQSEINTEFYEQILESDQDSYKIQNYTDRVGFCLDLCHAYVGGMIDMRDPDSVSRFMTDFDKKIGLENLKVIHFNDSKIKFNGHNDSHCDLLMGFIGNPECGGNSLGFRKIVEYSHKYNIPLIMETPGNIPINMQLTLLLSWSTFDTSYDIENTYLDITQEIRDTFTKDPKSGKGRRKPTINTTSTTTSTSNTSNVNTSATTVIPVTQVTQVPSATTVKEKPRILLKPLKLLPIKKKVIECEICSSHD